jgi:hypothetical protein
MAHIYLPPEDMPQWTRPVFVRTALHLPAPTLVAVLVNGEVGEILFEGRPNLCQVGFRAFSEKYGSPTFTSSSSERAEWSLPDAFASVACNIEMCDKEVGLGCIGRPFFSTQYRVQRPQIFARLGILLRELEEKRLRDAAASGRKL